MSRFRVTSVEKSLDGSEIFLSLFSRTDQSEQRCILRGFWTQTIIKEMDEINVIAKFDEKGVAVVDNSQGLIVVNPDHLISGTTTVGSIFCMRKSVFAEKFRRSNGPSNSSMVYGSIIHQLFQEILRRQKFTDSDIEQIINEVLRDPGNLEALYGAQETDETVREEIKKYIPEMKAWICNHIFGPSPQLKFQVSEIKDIEENIWSPRLGLKGKIDLTVEARYMSGPKNWTKKTVPLELKTGKPTFSHEHRGQVILYTMLSAERRRDPEEGFLFYLRDNVMRRVYAEHPEKRGLIQLRNDLVYYLNQKFGEESNTPLPPPINNKRSCAQCPYLIPCSIFLKTGSDWSQPLVPNHPLSTMKDESTAHLSADHIEYFLRWTNLIDLESSSTQRSLLSGIYCQADNNRTSSNQDKENVACTQLDTCQPTHKPTNSGRHLTTFLFRSPVSSPSDSVLSSGDVVIVSCDKSKEFAIATGSVVSVNESEVVVELDKNLRHRHDWKTAFFRLDRYEYGSSLYLIAGNLLQLVENSPRAKRLRNFVIDHCPPTYINCLDKSVLITARPILKSLNLLQMRAVVKALMTQDYMLIQGMPGTGKTCTIVALIKVLNSLGLSVLLASHTNSAVDNILLKLHSEKVDFLRLGKVSRVHPTILSYTSEHIVSKMSSVKEVTDMYNSKMVIATTCFGMSHPVFHQRWFDYCIIDEACQVMEVATIAPLMSSKKFIFVGDPEQLPPLVLSYRAREKGMNISLFEKLNSHDATVKLTSQYRMNSEIMRITNELVYDDLLQCASKEIAQTTLRFNKERYQRLTFSKQFDEKPWLRKVLSEQLEHSVLFLDTDELRPNSEKVIAGGLRNDSEADIVCKITFELLQLALSPNDIGIISPYRCQVAYIRKRLSSMELSQVEVNSIDQYQGRDKDVILISCVKSCATDGATESILHDRRRLNVAITRAKKKLILIGNVKTLNRYLPFEHMFVILREDQVLKLN